MRRIESVFINLMGSVCVERSINCTQSTERIRRQRSGGVLPAIRSLNVLARSHTIGHDFQPIHNRDGGTLYILSLASSGEGDGEGIKLSSIKFVITTFVFQAQNAPKSVFGGDPARVAYDAPPDPLVGWGGGYPLPIPHQPSSRSQRPEFRFRKLATLGKRYIEA